MNLRQSLSLIKSLIKLARFVCAKLLKESPAVLHCTSLSRAL